MYDQFARLMTKVNFNEYITVNYFCTYIYSCLACFWFSSSTPTKGERLRVFFYQDGVQVANDLQWFPDDQRHLNMNGKNLDSFARLCQCRTEPRDY
jgi:sulfur relay (sulfurtransferase) complex TusBCD TusD component (DsrE family)